MPVYNEPPRVVLKHLDQRIKIELNKMQLKFYLEIGISEQKEKEI